MLNKLFIQVKNSYNKKNFLHALFFALLSVLSFPYIMLTTTNKQANFLSIKKFSRRIGMSVLADYDISAFIRYFYLWIIAFGILFFLFNFIFSYLRTNLKKEQKSWNFLDNFSVIAFTVLLLTLIKEKGIAKTHGLYFAFFCLMVYAITLFYIYLSSRTRIASNLFFQGITSSFSLSCYMSYAVPSKYNKSYTLFVLLLFFSVAVILFFINKLNTKKYTANFFDIFTSLCALLPMLASFCIEGIYVLNQHFVFVKHIKHVFIGLFAIIFVFALVYAVICEKKQLSSVLWNEKWVFPIIIFGIVLCTNQPQIQSIYNPDIFESANYSILINDFLKFGKLPIIEHYGGHMLLNVISGIFYGLINSDFSGAIVSPYSNYFFPALCAVLFFIFLREIIGTKNAFFSCLLVPYESFYLTSFAVILLFFVCVIKFIKNPTLGKAYFIWGAFAWTTLSRLDLGFAVLGGGAFTLAFYCISNKNKNATKQLIISFCVVMLCACGLWSSLCLLKGINPVLRLIEFLDISSSNSSWAYTTLGDTSKTAFVWTYCFLPISICACTIHVLFSKNKKSKSKTVFYLFLLSAFVYFANIPRFIVRHNFAEGAHVQKFFLSGWFVIPLFIALMTKKTNLFIPSLSILFFLQNLLFVGNNSLSSTGYFERFANANKNIQTPIAEKYQRVILSDSSKEHYKNLSLILEKLLLPEESVVDFTNTTFIYSAMGKECPVYVSQSPSMLSGEFSQEHFIKEIEEKKSKLPLVLFPMSAYYLSQYVDGVPLVLRYYKVAEYLYKNYRPLYNVDDYAIWCDKDKYEYYLSCFSTGNNNQALLSLEVSKLLTHNCTVIKHNTSSGGSFSIVSQAADPFVDNFNSLLSSDIEYGKIYCLSIEYVSSVSGFSQLFFANADEDYSEQNSIRKAVENTGTIKFTVYLERDTRLRFDIPDGCSFIIKKIEVSDVGAVNAIDYGYDSQLGFHIYEMNQLSYLWANKDVRNAKKNERIAQLTINNDFYFLPEFDDRNSEFGNYVLLQGLETMGQNAVSVEFGIKEGDAFTTKYQMAFTTRDGVLDYILRPSIDYYWYTDGINAFKITSVNPMKITSVELLEGD